MAERAAWSEDGEPLNVEAAIADALEWLDLLSQRPIIRRDMDAEARLRASAVALAAYGDPERRPAFATVEEQPPQQEPAP